jgi:signal transduction histidine kinase
LRKRFISLKWQVTAASFAISLAVVIALTVYWQYSLSSATRLNHDEQRSNIGAIAETIYETWSERNVESLHILSKDESLRHLLESDLDKNSSTNWQKTIQDASINMAILEVRVDSYQHGKHSIFTENLSLRDYPAIENVSMIDRPVQKIMCGENEICVHSVSIPMMQNGKNVATLSATFPIQEFIGRAKASRASLRLKVVHSESELSDGWEVISLDNIILPAGFNMIFGVSMPKHLAIIQKNMKSVAVLAIGTILVSYVILFFMIYRRVLYIKEIQDGIPLMIDGDTHQLRAALLKKNTKTVDDELDIIGETLVETGEELAKLRQADKEAAEERARLRISEFLADERQQMLSNMAQSNQEMKESLARDLHDEVGSRIVSIRVDAALIKRMAPSLDLVERAERIERNCLYLSNYLRSSIESLHPPMIEALGFTGSINGLISEWQSALNVRTTFKVSIEEDVRDIPDALATDLYRIIQEALTNIAKYAEASEVEVILRKESIPTGGFYVVLIISDNGLGFDVEHKPLVGGRGLNGMRTRVAAAKGDFILESSPGAGTRIQCSIPVEFLSK